MRIDGGFCNQVVFVHCLADLQFGGFYVIKILFRLLFRNHNRIAGLRDGYAFVASQN